MTCERGSFRGLSCSGGCRPNFHAGTVGRPRAIGRGEGCAFSSTAAQFRGLYALIQRRGDYHLIDLGSRSNGSFVNCRRVSLPLRLHVEDQLAKRPAVPLRERLWRQDPRFFATSKRCIPAQVLEPLRLMYTRRYARVLVSRAGIAVPESHRDRRPCHGRNQHAKSPHGISSQREPDHDPGDRYPRFHDLVAGCFRGAAFADHRARGFCMSARLPNAGQAGLSSISAMP